MSPEAVHELIRDSNNAVSSFMMDWPAIGRQMAPRGEQPIKVYLCDGRVLLTGKADLAFGVPSRRSLKFAIYDHPNSRLLSVALPVF
ncbi:MAG: hypothetical protein ACT4OM_00740 [Actinomycetota bacterium]